MGLDMYLSARKYLSGWKHSEGKEKAEFDMLANGAGMAKFITPHAPSGYLEFNVAYWRKANQIHKWFVDTVQNGVDDCGEYDVERGQLKELRDLCQSIVDDPKKAEEELPTQSGFFFGGTDYDEYYLADLKNTVAQLDNALAVPEGWEFEYHSSW